jgi:Tfp pilus assembly protein PilF
MHACSTRYRLCLAVVLLASLSGCQSPGGLSGLRLPWSKTASNRPRPAPAHLADSEPLRPEQKADIQLALAVAAERQGRADDAKKIYLEVLKAASDRADVHHRLAKLYDRNGDCPAAEPCYQRAIRLDPKNAEFHCDLGYSYYLQQRWQEADASLRRAIALDPDLRRAHNNLGMLLGRTGRQDEALQEFVAAGCGRAEALANLGYALALTDRPDEAQAEFRRALAADPNLKTARDGLTGLESLAAGSASPAGPSHQGDVAAAAHIEPVTRPSEPGVEMRISD